MTNEKWTRGSPEPSILSPCARSDQFREIVTGRQDSAGARRQELCQHRAHRKGDGCLAAGIGRPCIFARFVCATMKCAVDRIGPVAVKVGFEPFRNAFFIGANTAATGNDHVRIQNDGAEVCSICRTTILAMVSFLDLRISKRSRYGPTCWLRAHRSAKAADHSAA